MTGSPRRYVRLPTAVVTLLLAAAVLPSLSTAKGAADPEITDACGDVDPGASLRPSGANTSAFQNRSAYDVKDVYVLLETDTDFLLVIHVCDIPDAWGSNETVSSQIPLSANASQPEARLVANFTIKSLQYEVRATLAHPSDGMLRDEYALYRGAANHTLQGGVNVTKDTVTVRIAKSLVGNPGFGDKLSKFRAEGWFGGSRLDFAPDAVAWSPDVGHDDLRVVIERLDGKTYYEPTYGDDYSFGSLPASHSLRIESLELGRVARAGDSVDYTFTVVNEAPLADQVVLTLSQPPPGFAHRLSATALALQAGEHRDVILTATAHEAARGDLYSLITASSTLGSSDAHAFVTRFFGPEASPPDPPAGSGPASDEPVLVPSDAANPPPTGIDGHPVIFPNNPAPPQKRATPAPGLLALLGVLAVAAASCRRR